jgi:hypothetical protein
MYLRNLKDSGATLNLTVEVTREWNVRVWLGLWLMKLGARVIGMNVEVDQRDG